MNFKQKLASLAQEICTLWFQFFGAAFASKGYPFKNIFAVYKYQHVILTLDVTKWTSAATMGL